ncbi:MAG: type III pantothenate kinase, partial [Butyrivibrio sp.]
MLLAIDMGNTNIVIGCIRNDKILFVERVCTDLSKTELEYAICFKTVLELYGISEKDIDGAIISSVVPPLTSIIKIAVKKTTGREAMVVGPGIKTGLNIHMDNPKTVGADLIVDAVAGISEYGAPLIIIDIGTATTVSVVDRDKNYIGGMIIPGIRVSMDSLVNRTSQLPRIGFDAPRKIIGSNTIDCMKSGIINGNAAMIDGLVDRIEEELGYKTTVIATGGLAGVVMPMCKH